MKKAYALVEVEGANETIFYGGRAYTEIEKYLVLDLIDFDFFYTDSNWILENKRYFCLPNENNLDDGGYIRANKLLQHCDFSSKLAFNSYEIIEIGFNNHYNLYLNGINLSKMSLSTESCIIYRNDGSREFCIAYFPSTKAVELCYGEFNDINLTKYTLEYAYNNYYSINTNKKIEHSQIMNVYDNNFATEIVELNSTEQDNYSFISQIYSLWGFTGDSLILPSECEVLYIYGDIRVNSLVIPNGLRIIELRHYFFSLQTILGTAYISSKTDEFMRNKLIKQLKFLDNEVKIEVY